MPATKALVADLVARTAELAAEVASRHESLPAEVVTRHAALAADVSATRRELRPNGGTSMRDTINRIETAVLGLTDKSNELGSHATANREGMNDLRDQAIDLRRRLIDVDEKAAALGDRQESPRVADQHLASDLQHYAETERRDLVLANEALRAALNVTLASEQLEEDQ